MTDGIQEKTTPKPGHVRSVWDNGGRTIDRYTVVIEQDMGKDLWAMLGLSEDPERGFSQFGECTEGTHLGKRIQWEDMPEKVRRHAAARMDGDDD